MFSIMFCFVGGKGNHGFASFTEIFCLDSDTTCSEFYVFHIFTNNDFSAILTTDQFYLVRQTHACILWVL